MFIGYKKKKNVTNKYSTSYSSVRGKIGIKTNPVQFITLSLEIDINKENKEKAKEVLKKINDYFVDSPSFSEDFSGERSQTVEDVAKLKDLFSQYWALCPDELQTGIISNRPGPLLEYLRCVGATNADGRSTNAGLDSFLRKNSAYKKQDDKTLGINQMIFKMKHPYWRYKIGSLVNINKSWDRAYTNRLRLEPTRVHRLRADTPAMFLGIKTMFVCTNSFANWGIACRDHEKDFPVKRNMLASHARTHFSRAYKDILLERIGKNETFINSTTDEIGTFIEAIKPLLRSEEEVIKIIHEKKSKEKSCSFSWEKDEAGGSTSLLILQHTKNMNQAMGHLRRNASKKKKSELLDEMFHRSYIDSTKECVTDLGELENTIGLLTTSQDSTDRMNNDDYPYSRSRVKGSFVNTNRDLYQGAKTLNKMVGGVWAMTLCPTVLYTKVTTKELFGVDSNMFKKDYAAHKHKFLRWYKQIDESEILPRTHYNMGRIAYCNDGSNNSDAVFKILEEEDYKKRYEKGTSMFYGHPMENVRKYDGMIAFFQTWYQNGKIIHENIPSCFCTEHKSNDNDSGDDDIIVSSLAMTPEEREASGYPKQPWFQSIFPGDF